MKKCPYCAEEIQDEAIVCKHCGRDLQTSVQPVKAVARPVPNLESVSVQGAKGAAVISGLYTILIFLTSQGIEGLIYRLVVGVGLSFLFWWVVCSIFVWGWRKVGENFILKVLFILGFLMILFGVIGSINGG